VYNTSMSIHRKVTRGGGSMVGRQLVIDPDVMDRGVFQKAFATVLRRYGKTAEMLAEFDRGRG
jgi:hypothetical protein